MKLKLVILLCVPLLLFNFCSLQKKSEVITEPAKPGEEWLNTGAGLIQTGIASWYGHDFHGKRTANGEVYDMDKLTAAHKYLPFHTLVEVENLDNNKKVTVRINDRGPFVEGRVIDLSRKAAQRLGIEDTGTARVRLRIVKAADLANIPQAEPTEAAEPAEPVVEKPPVMNKEELTITEVTETGTPPATFAAPPREPPPDVRHEPPPAVQKEAPGGYYLQAGAFGSVKNAKRLLRRIQQLIPDLTFNIQQQEGLYKIHSGKLDSKEAAEVLKTLLGENGIEAFIREGAGSPSL
jgi:rare lipoprotein A